MVRFKSSPQDFVVEEAIRLPTGSQGSYTVYRLEKHDLTTLEAQARLATALRVPRSALVFPALKDKVAQAVQYGTLRGSGPALVEGDGFRAERVGTSPRPLASGDLLGNRFTIVLRGLTARQGAAIPSHLLRLQQYGLPNYFDQQRFGSYQPGQPWVGKLILLRDAERALHAHLAQPFVGDPPDVRVFKQGAGEHWGEWRYLLDTAPRPSNFRSVLTFLADHPQDYRKALNLVTPRVLSIYLAAYQSWLWNRLAGRYLREALQAGGMKPTGALSVAGEALPFYRELPSPLLAQLQVVRLPLFQQRMSMLDSPIMSLVEQVLAEEGLRLVDLKARLLTKAYLSHGTRALLVFPQEASAGQATADDRAPGQQRLPITFLLPPGSYATLLLKLLVQS